MGKKRREAILAGMRLTGVSSSFEVYTSPQRVLRELGMPSSMLIGIISGGEDVYEAGGHLMMLYHDKGLVVYYPTFQIFITRPSKDAPGTAELCLNHLPPSEASYWVRVILTEPFPSGLSDVSPIQTYLFADAITDTFHPLIPFEETFGLSLEEVTALAQQKENACVYADVP